jgi:hypothetical protein
MNDTRQPFEADWRSILSQKIGGTSCEDCQHILFGMLIRFSEFRDQVDVQAKTVTKSMTEDDLITTLRILFRWVEDFVKAADYMFTRTPMLPAMVIYREPLALLQHILVTLEHGDSNVFMRLRQRKKNDRRDAWCINLVQRQAGLAYRVLRELGAGSDEAAECINKLIIREKRDSPFEVRIGNLSNQSLRREARDWVKNEIQQSLEQVRQKFKLEEALPEKGSARSQQITSVALHLLSNSLEILKWGGVLSDRRKV